jgi:hypothetical protein
MPIFTILVDFRTMIDSILQKMLVIVKYFKTPSTMIS